MEQNVGLEGMSKESTLWGEGFPYKPNLFPPCFVHSTLSPIFNTKQWCVPYFKYDESFGVFKVTQAAHHLVRGMINGQ